MTRYIVGSLAFLLLSGSAFAQDTGTGQTGQSSTNTQGTSDQMNDQDARTRSQESAERAGMTNVRILDRVFVVQGTTPQGETVFMIVNPPGALVGIGAPVGGSQGNGGSTGTGMGSGTGSDSSGNPSAPAQPNNSGTNPQ